MPIWAKILAVMLTLAGGFATSFAVATFLITSSDDDHIEDDIADIIDNVGISEEK